MTRMSLYRCYSLATWALLSPGVLDVALPTQCVVRFGRDFVARFDTDSFEFVPTVPDAVRRDAWRFRVTAVGRGTRMGNGTLPAGQQAVSDQRVSYARPGFVERYDIRADGVEQSFVFDALPTGAGDLVVRGRVTTELRVDAEGVPADELHFRAADDTGVRVGAVTGIDARGRTAAGRMRYTNGVLELVLPASFVDEAELPLVLDPLIGTIRSPSVPWAADSDPDVAYDETNDISLVVFGRRDPASSPAVRGQRVRPDGTVVGESFQIANGESPMVGNVASRDAFVVAYLRDDKLYARRVDAATAAVSPETMLDADPATILYDVGNSSSAQRDQVPVAYYRPWAGPGPGDALGLSVRVPSTGAPLVAGSFSYYLEAIIFGTSGNAIPYTARLCEIDSMPGYYLCAFDEWGFCTGGSRHVRLSLVDPDGRRLQTVQVSPVVLGGSSPDVAGEGSDFVVVYEQTDTGIVCQEISVVAGSLVLGTQTVVETSPVPKGRGQCVRCPSLARADGSYLLGFQRSGQNFVASLDPSTCGPCEGELTLGLGPESALSPAIRARTRAGRPATEAMLAWARSDRGRQWVEVSAFRADDGVVSDLGGGCAQGGRATVSCARAGNATFTHEVRDAAPQAQALLALGVGSSAFPCGPCTLVPDLAMPVVVAFSGTTNERGRASTTTPLPALPNLVGAVLIEQWLVVSGSGCPLIGMALSNGLAVEIQ